ncbi:MAG: hypothetical protein KC591_01270, partial [Gemmatimonadetes bacterium]|nr:hypothetical protein [Gemmatimonadota bacterium]
DVEFRNDYELLCPPDPLPPEHDRATPKHGATNKYPVGLAVLETPGFLVGHVVALAGGGRWSTDGVSSPYQVAVAFSLLALALAGFVWLRAALLAAGVPDAIAVALTIASAVATNAIHYVAKEPAMPHAAGMALVSFLLWRLVSPRRGIADALAIGAAAGLLLLVRNSNVALAPILGLLCWRSGRSRGSLVTAALAAIAVLALQPLSLHALWGDWRVSTYADEAFTGAPAGFWNGLLHARHGLFLYSPWYLVLVGLAVSGARHRSVRPMLLATAATFLAFVLVNGSWWCWWFGDSFGNRAYLEVLPVLTLAAGVSLSARTVSRAGVARLSVAVAAFTLANVYLWAGYVLQRFPQDGNHSAGDAWGWIARAADPGER